MRRFLAGAAVALSVLLAGGVSADTYPNGTWHSAETGADLPVVTVTVNGQTVSSDVPAVILDGRTLLPARAIATALGAQVSWDATRYAAAITTDPADVSVPILYRPPSTPPGGIFVACSIGGSSQTCSVDTGTSVFGDIPQTLQAKMNFPVVGSDVFGTSNGTTTLPLVCATISVGAVTATGKMAVTTYPIPTVGAEFFKAAASSFTIDLSNNTLEFRGVQANPPSGC